MNERCIVIYVAEGTGELLTHPADAAFLNEKIRGHVCEDPHVGHLAYLTDLFRSMPTR